MQLLEASSGFQAKDTVCTRALNFLCRDVDGELSLSDSKDEVQSHQMLEMILYKVTLNSQSGRFKTALNFFQVCCLVMYHHHCLLAYVASCFVFF